MSRQSRLRFSEDDVCEKHPDQLMSRDKSGELFCLQCIEDLRKDMNKAYGSESTVPERIKVKKII